LRESEHRYRHALRRQPAADGVYDYETLSFIAVNEAAVQHYGYSKMNYMGMTIEDNPAAGVSCMIYAAHSRRGATRNEPRVFRQSQTKREALRRRGSSRWSSFPVAGGRVW